MAPLLLISTLLVVGSGLALLVTGPSFLVVHVFSALFWLPLVAIDALAHAPRVPRLIADDWTPNLAPPAPGRERRLAVTLGAVIAGVMAAMFVQPMATQFFEWSRTITFGPGPFVVGIVVTAVALLVARPLGWAKPER